MNLMWPVWITASIAKFCSDNLKTYGSIYLEGVDDNKKANDTRFEIRIDGPTLNELNASVTFLEVYVNILVISRRGNKPYEHQTMVGAAMVALEQHIPIYKFGEGQDGSYAFCLEPDSKVITTNYGEITAIENLVQSTVECEYQILT